MLSKGTIALSAVGLAVVLVAGGYGASIAMFNPSLDKAKQAAMNFINKEANLDERHAMSIDFLEKESSGLFNRELYLYAATKDYTVSVPIQAKIGFLNYDFYPDLTKIEVNKENFIQANRDAFATLTKLEGYANVHLLTGKVKATINAENLNNVEDAEFLAETEQDKELFSINPAGFASMKGFGEVFTTNINFVCNKDLEMTLEGSIKGFLGPKLAVQEVTFSSSSVGYGDNVKELGSSAVTISNASALDYKDVYHAESITFATQATPFDIDSNFDMSFQFYGSNVDRFGAFNIEGIWHKLNYDAICRMVDSFNNIFAIEEAVSDYLIKYPLNLDVLPTSNVKFIDPETSQAMDFKLSGQCKTKGLEKMFGSVQATTPQNFENVPSLQELATFFEKTEDGMSVRVDFDIPFNYYVSPSIKVNGKPLSY